MNPATATHHDGRTDIENAAGALAERLPPALAPLARLAFNYRWSWLPGAPELFGAIDSERFALCHQNPVRLLQETPTRVLRCAADDRALVERAEALEANVRADLERPPHQGPVDPAHPVAFLCAEFGFHVSLPIYSGGLGVLAGDILKEASDQALPMIGIGLLYRRGYFRQRLDLGAASGVLGRRSTRRPADGAGDDRDGSPLRLEVTLSGATSPFQVWRVDVGRVPLLLLDTELPENDAVQRWTTARLYEGNRAIRLAQYGLLGIGGARVLETLGIEPGRDPPERGPSGAGAARARRGAGRRRSALRRRRSTAVREQVVFTTHTPVPAGNETYRREEFLDAFGDLAASRDRRRGVPRLCSCRSVPTTARAPGMTRSPSASATRRNGVSRLHGEVAREMWQPLFRSPDPDEVPIAHVTNGAHLPTFLGGADARSCSSGTSATAGKSGPPIPRRGMACGDPERRALARALRGAPAARRLRPGEGGARTGCCAASRSTYVRASRRSLEDDTLTLGFARRLATYKRLHLLTHDPRPRAADPLRRRTRCSSSSPGKAHPSDEEGKGSLQRIFELRRAAGSVGRAGRRSSRTTTCGSRGSSSPAATSG